MGTHIVLSGLSDGAHTVYVIGKDSAGNWQSQASPTTAGWTIQSATNQPPNQPTNVSPVNQASSVSLTPTLSSAGFSDPDSGDTHAASQWQLTTTKGNYLSPIFDSGTNALNLTQITISSRTLSYNTPYYWRVRYQDNHGAWSSWSLESSFKTIPTGGAVPQGNDATQASRYYEIGAGLGALMLMVTTAVYFWRRRSTGLQISRDKQKLEQWEAEGYDVSEFRREWFK